MDLTKFQKQLEGEQTAARTLPPVEQWNPPFCGDINLNIAIDGRWFYEGSPIGRASLVKLFASVLKKEEDNYYLVTPVEKVGIRVEDVPFVITSWCYDDKILTLTTQTGDKIALTAQQQLTLNAPPASLQDDNATAIPYVCVRRNLWGRLHQNVYYQLLEQADIVEQDDVTQFMLTSNDQYFCIGQVTQ